MRVPGSGGGWRSIFYSFTKSLAAGGPWKFYRALRSKNACKTCALGMGGQRGGMVNEAGRFPEVCKKSMQAMAADMQGAIRGEFWKRYGIEALRSCTPRELEHMGRLSEPVYAGPGDEHYRPVTWGEAFDRCAGYLRDVRPDQSFFYFSGRASNEAAFLWQLFARLYGSNHVNNCSYYCHQASGVGLKSALGVGTATVTLEDLERCDLFVLIGGNPASNHPRLMTMLADVRRRGGQVIAINPLREPGLVNFRVPSRVSSLLFGSPISSLYLQPHIGGDVALLTGAAKSLLERGAADRAFIDAHCEGYEEFADFVNGCDWSELTAASGVERADVERFAELYAASNTAIFGWTMGVTHHLHGVDNVRAIVNLALLRGMLGRTGAGLLPIRGHSNVQGVGSMGVTPQLAGPVLEALEQRYALKLPRGPGMDTLGCIQAAAAGKLRGGWCLGGNLYGATPDANLGRRALAALDSIVYVSTTLNTGHAHGRAKHTLILPARARDEESQPTTQESMFNYVRMSEGGPARLPEARSEVEIVCKLGKRVLSGGPLDWEKLANHATLRAMIAEVIPGYAAIGRIDATRVEFQIDGRTFHEPRFPTESGKARFHALRLPDSASRGKDGGAEVRGLRLMTIRSEGQFNTVVYEEEDVYRGQERRDVILMNPADIERFGLRIDDRVTVRSKAGAMENIRVRAFDARPGNCAMYCPEANVLVPAECDPESRTPAFKHVAVTIEPVVGRELPVK